MPIVNVQGKVTRLEGGDIATIALMAAFLSAGEMRGDAPDDIANVAMTQYNSVVENVNRFNSERMKAATDKALEMPPMGNPHEVIQRLLAQMSAAVNTIPDTFRQTSAWCRDAEKMLKQSGYQKNDDGQWARAT